MAGQTLDREKLVAAWIKMAKSGDESLEDEADDWAFSLMWDLVHDTPEEAWPVILAIIARDSTTPVQELLAAGPLEDLLAKHGPSFIERVEEEARLNARFAKLLGGVWKNSMTEDVWRRVQAVWDRRGWDGIPE